MKFAATMFENIIALSNLHFHTFNHSFDTTILSYEKKKKILQNNFVSFKRNRFLFL